MVHFDMMFWELELLRCFGKEGAKWCILAPFEDNGRRLLGGRDGYATSSLWIR